MRAHLHAGPVLPLSPDLESLRRVADDAGDVRRHDGRHHGGGLPVPREGLRAEVRRLAGRLRPGHRRSGRERAHRAAGADRRRRAGRRRTRTRRAACCRCSREGQTLDVRGITPEQKFTQPPPRFNEGSLVKALEENGIGRPSTYASIISVLQARDYVNKIEGKFRPTILGRRLVDKLLHPVFDDILDVEYTARMEEQLDDIEKGKADYEETLDDVLQELQEGSEARREGDAQLQGRAADRRRPATSAARARWSRRPASSASSSPAAAIRTATTRRSSSRPRPPAPRSSTRPARTAAGRWSLKRGRFGMFLACTGYPECKTTRKIIATKQGVAAAKPDQILDEKCPNCGKNLVIKQGRFGEFTACTGYPECKYVKQKLTGVMCPKDGGDVVGAQVAARQGVLRLRRTIRSATSRSGTSRSSSRARSAAGRSSPRRSPSATAASSSARTRSATTCARRRARGRAGHGDVSVGRARQPA